MCLPRHHCPAYLSHRRLRRSRCPAGWSKKRATTPTSRRVNTVNGCPTFSLACSHQPPMRTQRPALRPIPSPDRSRCRPAYLSTRPCRSQPAAGLGRLYQRRRKIAAAATVPHLAAESKFNPCPCTLRCSLLPPRLTENERPAAGSRHEVEFHWILLDTLFAIWDMATNGPVQENTYLQHIFVIRNSLFMWYFTKT